MRGQPPGHGVVPRRRGREARRRRRPAERAHDAVHARGGGGLADDAARGAHRAQSDGPGAAREP
eukprot:3805594-Prymnesium_polylepis.1